MPGFSQISAGATTRRIWLVIVSPLVCIAIGSVAGGIYIALAAIKEAEPVTQVALGFPMAMLASLLVAAPVGLVCGVLGAGLALALERSLLREAGRSRWLAAGAGAGSVAGVLVALFYLTAGADGMFAVVAVVACALSGTAVGLLGWREFGTRSVS